MDSHLNEMSYPFIDIEGEIGTYLLCGCRIAQIMDGLKERLVTAYKASGGRKVNLISHSMGGLLVSCFISLHSDVCSIHPENILDYTISSIHSYILCFCISHALVSLQREA